MRISHLTNAVVRGILPFQPELRRLKRRVSPYRDDPLNSHYCITNGLEQLAALRAASVEMSGADILEFGSGWLPLIPLLCHLAGARRLILTDIERLMDERTIARAKQLVATRIDDIAEVLAEPQDRLLARLNEAFRPDYIAPWNAASHPPGSADMVISRATLEHVPAEQLRFFLAQFHRIVQPGGTMCHLIDNSDHWQHKDRRLSRVDFLRYDEDSWVWRLAQVNKQAFQNRLRHGDYGRMFAEAGFSIVRAIGQPDIKCLDDLATIPLSGRFKDKAPDDLAILTSLYIVRKEAAGVAE